MNDSKDININKYLLVGIIVGMFGIGSFGGYHYTKQYYEKKAISDSAKDQANLICEARIQKGKTGDVKSDYFIFEQSANQEDCERFIEYKNIPDDTETFWLGF